ncbi:MAG: alpha/beta fold hydrolase [Actinophytocola sp.]|uniref:alpha/beta fold hydrolase n=1 Tax=Actinophytocola sp. TaxID=1872138 RepID=UPI001324180C|nr:alpha/beta hydrolase [Actinophytocola sp.]MPZ79492.1 alpha/beta fold hydrolase [Actinophytocola sp.]
MSDYDKGSVSSADGTVIGYRRFGSGPAVLLVHGGMQASQNFIELAGALATDFTVHVPDRRGRGLSGPHGDDYGVAREVEDVQALVAATGAARIFGLSSGALVALRTALDTPALERVALYEPPLSVNGSAPTGWLPRFDREIAAGKNAAALVTVVKGLRIDPVLGRIPRFVLVPLLPLAMRVKELPEDDVPMAELIPTQRFDVGLVRELADTVEDYAALDARVLLLGGSKSPVYLGVALDALADVLPHARRVTFDGLGHLGPDDDGDPRRVAETLRDFFLS